MTGYLKYCEYQPTKLMEHWCNWCDHKVVNSTKPETGKFYSFHGHYGENDDSPYQFVLFALCPECQARKE